MAPLTPRRVVARLEPLSAEAKLAPLRQLLEDGSITPEVYAHLDSLGARLATGLAKAFDDAGRDARVVRCASMVNVWPSAEPVSNVHAIASTEDDTTSTAILLVARP